MGDTFRKFISIVCVLALLTGLVPSAAFAAPYAAQAERASEPASGAVNGNSGEPAADRSGSFSPKTSEAVGEHSDAWQALQNKIDNAVPGSTITLNEDVTAGSKDGPLTIMLKQLTIDLNGHTINRNLQEAVVGGYAIYAAGTSTQTVSFIGTGTITGGRNTGDGGGIYVVGINLALKDSVSVTGNTAASGGGIYLDSDCTLYLYNNSSVTGNTAASGGGVYLNDGYLEMHNDSRITGNTAVSGGNGAGVYVGGALLRLKGGSISGNIGAEATKGIYLKNGSLELYQDSTVRLMDSVYLPETFIRVNGTPKADTRIHVTLGVLPTAETPIPFVQGATADWLPCFVVDNQPSGTELVCENNWIQLRYKSAKVSTCAELQAALDAGGVLQPNGKYTIRLANHITAATNEAALVFNYTEHEVTLDLKAMTSTETKCHPLPMAMSWR